MFAILYCDRTYSWHHVFDKHDTLLVQDIVNAICDDADIEVVSFVGSDAVSFTLA